MGKLPQLRIALPRVLERLANERRCLFVARLERLLSERERDDRVHQSLLRAVVQIAHHAAALLVGGGDDPGLGRGEIRPRLDVRDRGSHELGEVRDPRLRVGGHRLHPGRSGRDRPPQTPVHDDRARDGGPHSALSQVAGDRAGSLVVVEPRRPPGPIHDRRDALAFLLDAGADPVRVARIAPAADDRAPSIGFEAPDRCDLEAEQQRDLLGDLREHLLCRASASDHRRHAPQRRLLVCKSLCLCLGIAALGHVASHCVHEPVLDVWRRRPVEHPDRAVLADVTVLERHRRLSPSDGVRLRRRAVPVGRMDEVHVRAREELFLGVAENLLGGRVHTREPSVEVGNHHQVLRQSEDAVKLLLGSGSSRRVERERGAERDDEEAADQDDPRQDCRSTLDRLPRHDDGESLACCRERRGGRFAAITGLCRTTGGRDLHRRHARRCRTQPDVRYEDRHVSRAEDLSDAIGRRRDEKEPARAGSRGCHRGRDHAIKAGRTTERRGHPRCAAQIDPGHGHRRKASGQRRRQIGGARSEGHHPVARVGRHDGLPDTPLVRRTPRMGNLLDPCGGREARRAQPPQRVLRELVARDAGTPGIQHEPAQALGKGCGLGDAAVDLHRRDLSATVGVASQFALGEHAGDDGTHDGQRKEQRYSCDISRLHGQT